MVVLLQYPALLQCRFPPATNSAPTKFSPSLAKAAWARAAACATHGSALTTLDDCRRRVRAASALICNGSPLASSISPCTSSSALPAEAHPRRSAQAAEKRFVAASWQNGLTQREGTASQSRVAKMEAGNRSAPLHLLCNSSLPFRATDRHSRCAKRHSQPQKSTPPLKTIHLHAHSQNHPLTPCYNEVVRANL